MAEITASTRVGSPLSRVYDALVDPDHLAAVLSGQPRITREGDALHWEAGGRRGSLTLTQQEPDARIGWLGHGEPQHAGHVSIAHDPDGGTRVDVRAVVDDSIAGLVERVVDEALRRSRERLERAWPDERRGRSVAAAAGAGTATPHNPGSHGGGAGEPPAQGRTPRMRVLDAGGNVLVDGTPEECERWLDTSWSEAERGETAQKRAALRTSAGTLRVERAEDGGWVEDEQVTARLRDRHGGQSTG